MQKWMRRNALQALSVFYFIGENDTFQDFSARNSDAEMKKYWRKEVKHILKENKSLIRTIFLPKYRAIFIRRTVSYAAANSTKIFSKRSRPKSAARGKN